MRLEAIVVRLRDSVMLRQSALVFAGSMVLSVCGFASQAIASRALGVEVYGALAALIAAYTIAAIPGNVLVPVIARLAAEFRALHDDSHLRGLSIAVARTLGILGLAYLIVASAFAVPFARFLHVPAWSAPVVGLLAAAALLVASLRAVVQGTQDFVGYAVSNVVEGVAKVGGIVVLIAIGLRLLGGVGGFLIGPAAAASYLGLRLAKRYGRAAVARIEYDWRRIASASGGAGSAAIAQTLLSSVDLVLVRAFFPQSEAGLYAAAAIAGKILLYLVGFIPTVLLPQAADRHARGVRTREVLFGSLAMFGAMSVCGLLIFHYGGLVVLDVLVGRAYAGALPLLVPYGAAMVLLALISALTSYGIATHRLLFSVPLLVLTAITLGAIAAYHPTLDAVVRTLALGNLATALVVAGALLLQWKSSYGRVRA